MKKYVVSVDISPSEQLTDENNIKVMSLLFGLKSPNSFNLVGLDSLDKENSLNLKKWTTSSIKYKKQLVKHLYLLKDEGEVAFGVNICSDDYIKEVGTVILKEYFDSNPKITSLSKKGKPRVSTRFFDFNNKKNYDYDLLLDELLILGWYAHSMLLIHEYFKSLNKENVKLDVIIDKLPLDVNSRKAAVLKSICNKLSNDLVDVSGVIIESDKYQRDLLSDNIAGLVRELITKNDLSLYGFDGRNFGLILENGILK